MLGLARRAGRLSMGHDAAAEAIGRKKAKAVILCSDVSPRLVREFEKRTQSDDISIPLIRAELTINEVHFATGSRAGVLTVDDVNFADRIISLLTQEE